MSSGISKKDRDWIREQIRVLFPRATALFFGSRHRGDHKEYSDLDICLKEEQPLDLVQLGNLKEILSRSHLTYKVDLSDLSRVTPEFRDHILSDSEPL